MAISDAEILDIVRRLRSYMTTLDNCHLVINGLTNIDDTVICANVEELLPELLSTNKKVSSTLKLIENSKAYRDMLKKFNLKEELGDEEDGRE
jgi:hypothetical protein